MSIQSINWVNAQNQTVPINYDPAERLSQKVIQDKLRVVNNIYKKVDFSPINGAALFRNDATDQVEGFLAIKDGTHRFVASGTKSEGPGVAQVLTSMAKMLTPVAFAGKKAKAPTQPPAKQPLSLMA